MNYNVDHIVHDSIVWVRDDSGTVGHDGLNVVRGKELSSTEIRVLSAIANCKGKIDCRGLSLEDISIRICVRHVNEINWDSIPQVVAAKLYKEAHDRGTLLDSTIIRLLKSRVHQQFLRAVLLPNYYFNQTTLSLFKYLNNIIMLDMANSVVKDSGIASLLPLARLEWLNLTNTKISDEGVKKLTYPTKYRGKGCIRLRYINVAVNPGITQYGLSLLRVFPELHTLVTDQDAVVEVLERATGCLNWGHDGVVRWIADVSPKASTDPETIRKKYVLGNFYRPSYKSDTLHQPAPLPVPPVPLPLPPVPFPIQLGLPIQPGLPVHMKKISYNSNNPSRKTKRKRILCITSSETSQHRTEIQPAARVKAEISSCLPDLSSSVEHAHESSSEPKLFFSAYSKSKQSVSPSFILRKRKTNTPSSSECNSSPVPNTPSSSACNSLPVPIFKLRKLDKATLESDPDNETMRGYRQRKEENEESSEHTCQWFSRLDNGSFYH